MKWSWWVWLSAETQRNPLSGDVHTESVVYSFFGYSTSLLQMWGSRHLTTVEKIAHVKQGRTFTHLVLLTRLIICWGFAGLTSRPGMMKSLVTGCPSNETLCSGPDFFRHNYWFFLRHTKNVYQFTCTQQKASDNSEAGWLFQTFASTVSNWVHVTIWRLETWTSLLRLWKPFGPLC